MARPTETEKAYLAIISDPDATTQQKLDSSVALDKLRNQRTHYRNHTKAKELLGIGRKEAKRAATSKIVDELPDYWRGTKFGLETFPSWPIEKRREWLAINKLEN